MAILLGLAHWPGHKIIMQRPAGSFMTAEFVSVAKPNTVQQTLDYSVARASSEFSHSVHCQSTETNSIRRAPDRCDQPDAPGQC